MKKTEIFCWCVYTGERLPVHKVKMVRRIKVRKRRVKKTIHV